MITYETTPKNHNDLFRLYRKLGWARMFSLSQKQLDEAVENSRFSVYAYDGDIMVGTGRVLTDGVLHTYLCGLGVLEEYRCRGIGSKITRHLIDLCCRVNIRPQLLCSNDMIRFYEDRGFEVFGVGMKKNK